MHARLTVARMFLAATVLSEQKAGNSFDGFTRQYGIVPSRDTGAELPWVSFKAPRRPASQRRLN